MSNQTSFFWPRHMITNCSHPVSESGPSGMIACETNENPGKCCRRYSHSQCTYLDSGWVTIIARARLEPSRTIPDPFRSFACTHGAVPIIATTKKVMKMWYARIGLTGQSSATAGGGERGLQWRCFHNLKRSIGTASGSLQRLVRSHGMLTGTGGLGRSDRFSCAGMTI